MGELYTLEDANIGGDYQPLTDMIYDQRHHVLYSHIPFCSNIALWYPLKSCQKSPQVRLIMEAMRGFAHKQAATNNYKSRNTLADLWKAPWQTPRTWLKTLLHKVYKSDEDTCGIFEHYIDQNIKRVSTKRDVLKNIYHKHEGNLLSLGLMGTLGILTTLIHKISNISYFKSFLSSCGLCIAGIAYQAIAYQEIKNCDAIHIVKPIHPGHYSIPSPITPASIITHDSLDDI
jgi:hypothetical protein